MATKRLNVQELELLGRCALFSGISPEQIPGLLIHIHSNRREYQKGSQIVREGEPISEFGILLSGGAHAVKEDLQGRPVLISLIKPGGEIGVLLAASRGHTSPVTVQAAEDSAVLVIPFHTMIARCSSPDHNKLLFNYVGIVAEKGLLLHDRISCLLKPSVREKVKTYLALISNGKDKVPFEIPLDRAGMADYLNVDRSALSRELSRMKKDGLIDYYKNTFVIL
ncbi:Crp/Fnr family transcriptional regulator [Anaerolentibacter hominis]|uniref:Crp/Fnr family transcriptional regulator n=1 Tax=Anaerolentibacter hominis TaxID=3079009 RepID=UPI0031B8A90F